MTIRKTHYLSGLIIALFVGFHLFNHLASIYGPDKHIELMSTLRHFYRNIFTETILFFAVLVQIISGLKLFKSNRSTAKTGFEKLHIWTGLYLAIFLAIPSKFSEYGHVFGWLLEGSALIILGFLYKESYVKNLGYLVLLLNLGKFFTLPYGDFFYSSTVAYPLMTFELNRGMIYIFLLISFYGLIPFFR